MQFNKIILCLSLISTTAIGCEVNYPRVICPLENIYTVNFFEKDFKFIIGVYKPENVISIIPGTNIIMIDKGMNLDHISENADTLKIVNDRILLMSRSNKLYPSL